MVYLKKYFIHLCIVLSLSALVSFSFEDETGSTETILDVENIAIDLLNPLKLYLHNSEGYFKEGDGLNVSVELLEIDNKNLRKILGGGKLKHLKLIFTNLETSEEFEVLSQDLGQTIKFGDSGATTGNYSVIFTGTKRLTPMRIRMTKAYGTPPTQEERNTPYDIVRIETMFIGDYAESKPIFHLPLQEGDRISATTSSALTIKFQRLSDGRTFNMPQAEPLVAENTETWKLLYSLEVPDDPKGFLNFRKGNKRFIDLTIKRYPYISPNANGGVGGLAGDGSTGNGDGTDGEGAEVDPMTAILSEMGKGSSDNSAIMAKALSELQKSMEEMNKKTFKNKPEFVGSSSEEEVRSMVAPKLDLTGKNRFCKKIQFSEKGLYWAYWIGVSEESNEIYKKTQEKTLKRTGSGTLSLIEHYASIVTENVNKKVKHPGFSEIEIKLSNAGEFVEYAIVNELNKEKFERGEKYKPIRPGWAKRNAVTDYGNTAMLEDDEPYICLCNENKVSPLDVYFRFEVYNLVKQQI